MNLISRDDLARWLDDLATRMTLVAPRNVDGVLLYRPVESSAELVWDFTRPALSIKELFFPPTESLFVIEKSGNGTSPDRSGSRPIKLTETLPEGQSAVFGVRPCDARGVRVLDALFLDTAPVDPYYARRREQTTLIGLACKTMAPSCFCTSLGGAPDDPRDVDAMLTEVEGGYAVQAITEKGRTLLPPAWEVDLRPAIDKTTSPPPSPLAPPPSTLPPLFSDDCWTLTAERCLGCRICAYVCPTCRCFDVRDEALPPSNGHERWQRIRCWGSCAGAAYRRIAGGHNPRPEKGQRLRNRFFCKFHYYPEQYGPVACTGCGRCIDACPVNIDITEILAHVSQTAGAASGEPAQEVRA